MIRSNPRRRPIFGQDLSAALAYYGVAFNGFATLSGMNPLRVLAMRKLKEESDDRIPLWVEWALLNFELDHRSRRRFWIDKVSTTIGLEVNEVEVSADSFRRVLAECGVSVGTFARHTGRNVLAIHDYAKGVKPVPRWVCWPLVLYAEHPEARVVEMPLDLPLDAWHQPQSTAAG